MYLLLDIALVHPEAEPESFANFFKDKTVLQMK